MDIDDLINDLTEIREAHGNIEVRLACQPAWPFQHAISGIAVNDPSEQIDNDDEESEEDDETETVAFIGQGHQLGYLSGRANKVLKSYSVW